MRDVGVERLSYEDTGLNSGGALGSHIEVPKPEMTGRSSGAAPQQEHDGSMLGLDPRLRARSVGAEDDGIDVGAHRIVDDHVRSGCPEITSTKEHVRSGRRAV